MHIVADQQMRWRVKERGADPQLFLPSVDWPRFRGANIIGDY